MSLIPAQPARPFTLEELAAELAALRAVAHEHELEELEARLLAGREKYAGSFCEVDLHRDLLEELTDAIAYAGVLIPLRMMRAGVELDEIHRSILEELLADLLGARRLVELLPTFEGPTSNEWAEAHGR